MSLGQSTKQQFDAGKARRAQYVGYRNEQRTHVEALAMVGVTHSAYRKWRRLYKDFAATVDSIALPHQVIKANTKWTAGFSAFRREYFGNESTWFHEKIVQALEAGEPGSITLITIPPEHGKTTTLEDYCNYKLATEPTFRITIGSETLQHARKFIGRVKNRMEDDGPYPKYVHRFGPFRAPDGSKRLAVQPWTATYFDVFKKGNFDERDYSLAGAGITTAIAGTRTNLLVIDDPQSFKTLDQTEKRFQLFRQDWLSRPGALGRTVVLMTRQGEDDFAYRLMESGILDYHIVLPAWADNDTQNGWLWPERYTDANYARMKRNVGQDAWDRNYMQIARPEHTIVFTRENIKLGRHKQRSILNIESNDPQPWPVLIGLDPGFKITGLTAAIDGPKFQIIEARKIHNIIGTEGIIAETEDLVARVHLPGVAEVTDLVIESMAFQKGLLTDERMLAMRRAYGFRILPHETGQNKYDRDLGVPQMVRSLLREEIEWPWGDDISREQLKELEDDMYRWRPGIKGSELEQDVLMSTWFIWLLWRKRRRMAKAMRDTSNFNTPPSDGMILLPKLIVPSAAPMLKVLGGRR